MDGSESFSALPPTTSLRQTEPAEPRRRRGKMLRLLQIRRRIDPILLIIGMATFAVKLPVDMIVFAYFIGVGVYFIAGRHRITNRIDPDYRFWCLLYAAYAFAAGLIHGNLPGEIRWIGYPVYLVAGLFLMVGFGLIRDPLRQIALGARIAAIVAVPVAVVELAGGQLRIGFGGNEANTAFVMIIIALLARHSVRQPPRFLPNSRLWFYLAVVVVMLTGTRAVLPVVAIALAFDLFAILKAHQELFTGDNRKRAVAAGVALVCLIGVAGVTVSETVSQRIEYSALELSDALAPKDQPREVTGLGIRMTLWRNTLTVIAEHPLIGVGGEESMRLVKQAVPPEQVAIYDPYVHVHNFVLDELRQRGIIGLALMLAFYGVVGVKIWRNSTGPARETEILFFAALISYGSLHGLLLSDRNVLLISIVLTALLLECRQRTALQLRSTRHPSGSLHPRRA